MEKEEVVRQLSKVNKAELVELMASVVARLEQFDNEWIDTDEPEMESDFQSILEPLANRAGLQLGEFRDYTMRFKVRFRVAPDMVTVRSWVEDALSNWMRNEGCNFYDDEDFHGAFQKIEIEETASE